MSYLRVIPRDLFNEANLLKCLGQLWLCLDRLPRGHRAQLGDADGDHSGAAFQVEQDENSGAISVVNLPFAIRGQPFRLYRPLNSRQPWPLWCSADDDSDEVAVFDHGGALSLDFLRLIGADEAEPVAERRPMYVRAEPNGLFALRQERFRAALDAGREHPHDVCAIGRSREELRSMCAQHWPDVDYSEPGRRFRLVGTRRRLGALGAHESFDTIIIATTADEAKATARDNWADNWEHVQFTAAHEAEA